MGLALLVLGLGVMSVTPDLHDWVHQSSCQESDTHSDERSDPPTSDANHSCAIVAYAGGITLAIDTVAPFAIPSLGSPAPVITAERLRIASPAHLLPPGRGPPARLSLTPEFEHRLCDAGFALRATFRGKLRPFLRRNVSLFNQTYHALFTSAYASPLIRRARHGPNGPLSLRRSNRPS